MNGDGMMVGGKEMGDVAAGGRWGLYMRTTEEGVKNRDGEIPSQHFQAMGL
jgi:hypothetical protein